MSEFGLPQRSATSDANAGVVDAPSLKQEVRNQNLSRTKAASSLDAGIEAVGSALGNALQEKLTEEANNINEQRALDATIRQGTDHAINQIDANKKRTGWERGVFGEDVGYRAAQQKAVQNAVNAQYLEQATRIDEFAGEDADTYKGRLKQSLDQLLEPFADDQETKQQVTAAWMTASGKLAAKQHESHYAYTQTQLRETTEQQIKQTFDTWSIDAQLVSTPEEAAGLLATTKPFFQGQLKPKGMTDLAYRDAINSQLNDSLRKGNIGAYNAAKANGWFDSLKPAEQVKLDQALSAYDTDFSQKVALTYEEAELAAVTATTPDAAKQAWFGLDASLDHLKTRSTGSERAELALARGHTGAAKASKAIDDIGRKAAAKAAETASDAARFDSIKVALRQPAVPQGAALSEIDPKKSEIEEAYDSNIVDDVSTLVQSEQPLTTQETAAIILRDPGVAKAVAGKWKNSQVESPMVKTVAEAFINGWGTMLDENDRPTEEAKNAMISLSQFALDEEKFRSTIGADNFDKWEMIRRGVQSKQTFAMVEKEMNEYFANKGDREKWASQWPLNKETHQSKQDYVSERVQRWTKQAPVGSSLAHYMEEFQRGLQVYKGDFKAAESYLRRSVLGAAVNYKGRAIVGGKNLNDVTEHTFETLLDGVQRPDVNLLTGYISAMLGNTQDESGEPIRRLDQIPSWEMYTEDGVDGFFITSPEAKAPVRISTDVMKVWSDTLNQRDKFTRLKTDVQGDALFEAWKEEQELLQQFGPLGLQ